MKCRHKRQPLACDVSYVLIMATPMKTIRKEKGLSQETVAKAAGLSRSHYSEIENGKKPFNSYRAISIAKALDVDPGALYPSGDLPSFSAEKAEIMDLIDAMAEDRSRFERFLAYAREQARLAQLDQEQARLAQVDREREQGESGGD